MRIPSAVILLAFLVLPLSAAAFCFDEAAQQYGVSPQLLRAIAKTESGLRPDAVNRNPNGSYDVGIMQINSFWFPKFGVTAEQLKKDSCLNVRTGADILSRCMQKHGYTWEAVGCYNAYSHSKRVAYSWRIFRALKADSRVVQREKRDQNTTSAGSSSSLQFAVREREL